MTPASSSRLDLVGRWFAGLAGRKLRRPARRSVTGLEDDIRGRPAGGTRTRPFTRAKAAGEVLEAPVACCRRTLARHGRAFRVPPAAETMGHVPPT